MPILIANKFCEVEKMLIIANRFIYPIIIGKCTVVGVKLWVTHKIVEDSKHYIK